MKSVAAAILCSLLFFTSMGASADRTTPQLPAVPAAQAQEAAADNASATDLKLQQQQLAFFKERLDLQDKRIGDISLYLAVIGALFGALITAVVVFFSFRSTSEAKLAAREEARKEIEGHAKRIIGDWLNNDGRVLLEGKINGFLQPEVAKALEEIQKAASCTLDGLEAERQKAHEHNIRLDELISRGLDKDKPLSAEQKEQISTTARELQAKPPKQYRFEDWFVLGVQAFEAAKYEIAAEHFATAAAVAERSLEHAGALVSKGAALGRMGKSEEAIAIFEDVVSRFGEALGAGLQEQLVRALVNKGIALSELKRDEEAMHVFDQVLKRWGEAPEAALRELVGMALNGMGFCLLSEAKRFWKAGDEAAARGLLAQALEKINAALARKPDDPIRLGNQGYILFLQGRIDEARPILAKAIAEGGEELRQTELKDADTHPLPQDAAFKALIESL